MGCIEAAPELVLVPIGLDRGERQDQRPVEQVTPDCELLDPVQAIGRETRAVEGAR